MSFDFFAYISRMRYIDRWALMRNTDRENIQEHSHRVAVIAHALAVITNRFFDGNLDVGEVALYALYHDASEIITGDMPTPIKYYSPAIRDSYKEIERGANESLLSMLPAELQPDFSSILMEDDPEIAYIVKVADKLDAHLKCIEELKAGNMEFKQAKEQTWLALQKTPLPALDYFVENFLSGFELTLDELNQNNKENPK